MNKDFKSYYDLWTTVDKYRKNHDGWVNGSFFELDA
jgi:hypothetical protein